jgi:hypothetical protein
MKKEAKRGRKKSFEISNDQYSDMPGCEKDAGHVVRRFRNAWGCLKKTQTCVSR